MTEEGERTDYGVSVTEQGDVYKGHWKKDKPDGLGYFIRYNGDYYEGLFKEGLPHGLGSSKEGASGSVYKGSWELGHKSIQGTETYPDGCTYKGTFFLLKSCLLIIQRWV